MLFKILMQAGSVILLGMLLLLRACVVGSAFHHAHQTTVHSDAAFAAPQGNYRDATVVAAADNSGWIVFNTTDPQTGLRTRHARLTSGAAILADGRKAAPNVLELLEQGSDDHHIHLTLQAPARCPGVTSVQAVFGAQPATLAARPLQHEAACTVELLPYASVLQSLNDAETLIVSAGDGPRIRFQVANLPWD